MDKSKIEYRSEPTTQCAYLLETTPHLHYVSATSKIIEIILINRFGKKNIPIGIFWRLKDTSKEVFGAQYNLWGIVKRLLKTYDGDIIISMVRRRNIKYMTTKLIARYLFWCKEEIDEIKRIEEQKVRYNKHIELSDAPVIDIKQKEEQNLRDWLDI